MPTRPKKELAERLIDTLERANPLERLRALVALQDALQGLHADALDELSDAGWSGYGIARELGVSHQRLYGWRSR